MKINDVSIVLYLNYTKLYYIFVPKRTNKMLKKEKKLLSITPVMKKSFHYQIMIHALKSRETFSGNSLNDFSKIVPTLIFRQV